MGEMEGSMGELAVMRDVAVTRAEVAREEASQVARAEVAREEASQVARVEAAKTEAATAAAMSEEVAWAKVVEVTGQAPAAVAIQGWAAAWVEAAET